MKTKLITTLFIGTLIVFSALNIGNVLVSGQLVINQYLLHDKVEGVHSAKELIGAVETEYNDNFIPKMKFIELQGLTRLLINSKSYNTVLKLKNGYLTYQYGNTDVREYASNISELNSYVKSQGADFIYVAVPFKLSPRDGQKQIPIGAYEYSNSNQDEMLSRLKGMGVDTFDLRHLLAEEKEDWYSAFFKTDQHWKPETAFWAYG